MARNNRINGLLSSLVTVLVLSSTFSFFGPTRVFGFTPDFSTNVTASSITIQPGFWGVLTTVSVDGISGFTGTVSLFATAAPSFAGSLSFFPPTLTFDGDGYPTCGCTSELDVSSASAGIYNITVTGTSGSLAHSDSMTLIVTDDYFTLSAYSLTISQGSGSASLVTLTSVNSFSGTVSLSENAPSVLSASLSPVSVSLSPGSSGVSRLTVAASNSTPTGDYIIGVTGKSGPMVFGVSLTVTVTLAYFVISVSPVSLDIPLGSQKQTLTTVTWLNGFSSAVTLQAVPSSTDLNCVFLNSSSVLTVTESPTGSTSQYLMCTANGAVGAYTVRIYGTSGPYQQLAILPVRVSSSDPTISIQQTVSFDHVVVTINGNVSLDATTKTVTGTILVTMVNSTSGQTGFSKSIAVSLSYGSTARFVLSIPTSSYWLGATCSLNVSSNTASCSVIRDPDLNHGGAIDILDVSQVALAYDSKSGDSRYSAVDDLNADGRIDIFDVAIAAFAYQLPVFG